MKRPAARSFEDLVVWQRSHALVLEIYRATSAFPKTERYGLTSQLRRAAVSVPANVAEGFIKRSESEKARFVNIAQGSLQEVGYYLILARDLGYLRDSALVDRLDDAARLLAAYARALLTPRGAAKLLTPSC